MTTNVLVPLVDYIEDGVTTVHPIPYKFLSSGDLVVSRVVGSLAPVTLTLGVDYTAEGAGEASGGSLVKSDGGTSGALLVILRRSVRSQGLDFTPNDTFPAEDNETALDRLSLIDQEQDVEIARALKVAVGSAGLAVGAIADGQVLALIQGMLVGIDNDPGSAADSAAIAAAQRVLAEAARTGAEEALTEVQEVAAAVSDDAFATAEDAAAAALYAGVAEAYASGALFANTADPLTNGVLGSAITANGTGGTDGTYTGTFTGGAGSGATFRFVVASGAIVPASVVLLNKGTGYTSTPSPDFSAATGLTGATATVTIGPRTTSGDYLLVAGSGNTYASLYKNVAGVITSQGLAIPSKAALDALLTSLQATTYNYIGRPQSSPPGAGNSTLGNQYYTFKDTVTQAGQPVLEFTAAASGTAQLGVWKPDLSLRGSHTFTIAGAGAQSLTNASVTVQVGDYVALIASTGVLPVTTGSTWDGAGYWSGSQSGGTFPATLVQSGGSSSTRIEASIYTAVTTQIVTAATFAAVQAALNGIAPQFAYDYEFFGPPVVSDSNNAAASAHTYIYKAAVDRDQELDGCDITMHAAGSVKFKTFTGSNTAGFTQQAVSLLVTLPAAGTYALSASDFGVLGLTAAQSFAVYGSGIAYDSTKVVSNIWQLNGDASSGTTTTAPGGTLMVRPRFRAKAFTGARSRQSYSYDPATGSALLLDTAIAGTGGIILMVLGVGQSLALGYNTDAADPAITTVAENPGYGLMPNAGVIPAGAAISSFVDLVETTGATSHETPASGCVSALLSRLNTRHGYKPQILYAIAGKAGQAYAGGATTAGSDLKRGSATYAEAIRVMSQCQLVAAGLGKKLIVIAVNANLGEQDFNDGLPAPLFQRALDQFQSNLEEDARRITGQSAPVPMYLYQTCRSNTTVGNPAGSALAQIAAPLRNPKLRCVGPIYYCPQATDGAHVKSRGYRWIGRQYGTFMADDLFGPYRDPLRVIAAYWSASNKFCLQYNRAIALETDDSKVVISTLVAGLGVDFDDASGASPTVTAGALKAGTTDTLEVTLSGAPAGLRQRAWVAAKSGGGSGNISGPRSAIRSSASFDTDPSDGSLLYDWAPQEEIAL